MVRGLVVHITKRTLPNARIGIASDGREALARISNEGADLVITDLEMPGMAGDELIRKLRAQQLDTPVIIVSGSPRSQSLDEEAQISGFVLKTEVGAALPRLIRSLQLAA